MKLVIDTRNGIAGDIVSAALIGLGADEKKMISSMEYAGNHIGATKIRPIYCNDTTKLVVRIKTDYAHLHESNAKEFLAKITNNLDVNKFYREIATRTLNALCDAERYVHSHDKRLYHMLHHHHHDHKKHSHKEIHHHREHNIEAVLHEAKDILIDVTGLITGLTEIDYLNHVNVGNGIINFSHGEFEVPAPATKYILNKYSINWKKSDANTEMATPTGASILVGCNAERINDLEDFHIVKRTLAGGTKNLPPVSFYLVE